MLLLVLLFQMLELPKHLRQQSRQQKKMRGTRHY